MSETPTNKTVFIGYRRSRDSQGERRSGGSVTAGLLARFLQRLGFEVWYDEALSAMLASKYRVNWKDEIDRKLHACGTAIILWSNGAQGSDRLIHELAIAHSLGKELILSVDGVMPSEPYEASQVLDFRDFDALEIGRYVPTMLERLVRQCGLPSSWPNLAAMLDAINENDLAKFRFGNLEIPATVLLGTPEETYGIEEVECRYIDEVHHERSSYPALLTEKYDFLLDKALNQHEVKKDEIRDNPLVRIDSYTCRPEGPNDEKGSLVLSMSRTSYFQIWATNVAIDIPIEGAGEAHANTLRRLLCSSPTELALSVLANNLSVETMIVTDAGKEIAERSILIRRRRQTVAGYRGWYQSSSSGHFALAHRSSDGTPSPFVSAEREAKQEVDYALDITPADFKMFGLVLKHQDLHPRACY